MGKDVIERFDLTLDKPNDAYFEGQTIYGIINLTLNQPLEAREITVKVFGQGFVKITTSGSHNNRSYSKRSRAEEIYVNQTFSVWGNGSKSLIPEGENVFQFSCQLPLGIPSSFEGTIGYVRYYCKCKIDRPWRFDISCKTLFTVNSFVDLNVQPEIRHPVSVQAFKYTGCLCCRSGPLTANVHLKRTGYVPGESIYINAEINNLTRKQITFTKAILVMTAVFIVRRKRRKQSEIISEVAQDGVNPGQTSFWNSVPLAIPSVPPSRLVGCSIIDITYKLKFIIGISGCSLNLRKSIPITIGTIPLLDNFDSFMPASQLPPYQPIAPFSEYPDLPPPSYQECILGIADGREEDDNEHVYGNLTYTPSYAFYPTLGIT